MADFTSFTKGGRGFYRFGAYEIEQDLAQRGGMKPFDYTIIDDAGNAQTRSGEQFVEDEFATQRALSDIAIERSNRAAYAADQGMTTGSQTGYKNTRARMGTAILTGGGRATGSSLTRGRKASAILGG